MIENIIDFDPKQEIQKSNINYNDIIKSSSSEKDSNSASQQSIKIDSDYSDDLKSISSIEKIQISENPDNGKFSSKNEHKDFHNKITPHSIYFFNFCFSKFREKKSYKKKMFL